MSVSKPPSKEAKEPTKDGPLQVYRPVKVIDLTAGTLLDFELSVYLTVNRKYLQLTKAGDEIDAERLQRIKSRIHNLFVPIEQMPKFYAYSAKRLRVLSAGPVMSATERKERLVNAVRDLISTLFTERAAEADEGQAILKDCGEIVKTYILQDVENEWYGRVQQVLGDRADAYAHNGNVSTLAALFSIGLGIGKPEELALAGLLHDIGISELPVEVQKNLQSVAYQKHPRLSLDLMKKKKMTVSDTVAQAILQHHEYYNGQGYPNHLYGNKICPEAQVLALADHFEDLMSLHDGERTLTAAEAVLKLREEQVNDPSKLRYSPELLKRLIALFP